MHRLITYIGHNYTGHNYIGHDYTGHNCIGHNCIGASFDNNDLRLTPDASSSALYRALCDRRSGACAFPLELTLAADLACHADECNVDTVTVVKIVDGARVVYYEYVPAACVQLAFYEGRLIREPRDGDVRCANPLTVAAGAACCTPGGTTARAYCKYLRERVTYGTHAARCPAGRSSCSTFLRVSGCFNGAKQVYSWTSQPCSVRAQVDAITKGARIFNCARDI